MTLLLTNDDIAPLIDPAAIVGRLDDTYRSFALGEGVSAPRLDLLTRPNAADESYQLGVVAGIAVSRYAAIRIKSDMVYRQIVGGQPRKEKYCVEKGHFLGLILLFSSGNGALLAILHDGLIQKMRVGADSAIGARYMARKDPRILAILGSGGMAESHLACMRAAFRLEEVRVYSPTMANRDAFAGRARESGIAARAVASAGEAAKGADIVCACTNAIGPVLSSSEIEGGQHVTAIGGTLDASASASIDVALRLGTATVPAEHPDHVVEEECLTYAPAGAKASAGGTRRFAQVPPDRTILLSDLLADRHRGRTNEGQITFSERGNLHGVQFAAVAGQLYERARAAGAGTSIPPQTFLETIRN